MKKTVRVERDGIVQVTVADERWYFKPQSNKEGIPEVKVAPSVTWITSFYPKGIGYMKWLSSHGWDDAEALKMAAAEKGSKVHKAIEMVLEKKEIKMDTKVMSPQSEQEEELTLEEYEGVKAFVDWHNEQGSVTPILGEYVVFSELHNYAGTVDFVCKIDGQLWIIDFKTSQNVYPSHEIQLAAYREALKEEDKIPGIGDAKLAVLQIGYHRNKKRFKFNEVDANFRLFLATQQIWRRETKGQEPMKRDYPIVLKLK